MFKIKSCSELNSLQNPIITFLKKIQGTDYNLTLCVSIRFIDNLFKPTSLDTTVELTLKLFTQTSAQLFALKCAYMIGIFIVTFQKVKTHYFCPLSHIHCRTSTSEIS